MRGVPKILRQARDRQSVAGLELNAINSSQRTGSTHLSGKTGNLVQSHRRFAVPFMGHCDLNAIRK